MRHTPGSWYKDNPHGESYFEIWHGEIGDKNRECIAEYVSPKYADLIASAPDLLVVIYKIMPFLLSTDIRETMKKRKEDHIETYFDIIEEIQKIIAKAEGK